MLYIKTVIFAFYITKTLTKFYNMKKIFAVSFFVIIASFSFSQSINIALNKVYSASIMDSLTNPAHNPRLAFDGDTLTVWHPQAYPTQWIAVNFPNPMRIDSITFRYGQNPAGTTTQNLYSTINGTDWVLAQTINPYHILVTNGVYPQYTHIFSTSIENSLGFKVQTTVNPSWIQWKEIQVWGNNMCYNMSYNDTTTFYVSSNEFQNLSPRSELIISDSLLTHIGGCDSIVNHYAKYIYNPNYCSDTIHLTVTDTLIINANLTSLNPLTYQNTIKIYPNPTNDHIIIDFGSNYSTMNGYTLKITNTLSQVVYTTLVNSQQTTVDLSTWNGNGIYFVHLIDAQSNTIDIRKIVLQ